MITSWKSNEDRFSVPFSNCNALAWHSDTQLRFNIPRVDYSHIFVHSGWIMNTGKTINERKMTAMSQLAARENKINELKNLFVDRIISKQVKLIRTEMCTSIAWNDMKKKKEKSFFFREIKHRRMSLCCLFSKLFTVDYRILFHRTISAFRICKRLRIQLCCNRSGMFASSID